VKRLSTGLLAALVAVGIGTTSVSAQSPALAHGNIGTHTSIQIAQAGPAMPPADFGTLRASKAEITSNHRHLYAKPDRLKAPFLAALVRGNTILIPLRSMFEQMGATVSYDPASKTVDVSKPGSDVKVTVGRPEVVINGESRPLDVPPEIYKGAVVVPVRVISEGMGAYVQWVPDRRIVVWNSTTRTTLVAANCFKYALDSCDGLSQRTAQHRVGGIRTDLAAFFDASFPRDANGHNKILYMNALAHPFRLNFGRSPDGQ
jgi:hypothetical protein